MSDVFKPRALSSSLWANAPRKAVRPLLVIGAVLVATGVSCVPLGERALVATSEFLESNAGLVEKRVQVAGHNIVYLEGGQGTPLLILHGFSSKKEHFDLLSTSLVPHHRVFIPDIPGFGESSYDPAQSYAPSAQVERLIAFADAVGLQTFAIAGNSMGGHLSALIAAKIPDRITHVVLLSPSGVLAPEKSDFMKILENGTNPFAMKTDEDADKLLALQFYHAPDAVAFVKPALLHQMKRRGARNASLFRDYRGERFEGIEDKLPGVVAPTLVLWGDQDQMLHPSGGPIFIEHLPRGQLIPLQQCGHLPQMERPTETAAHMLRFLATTPAN